MILYLTAGEVFLHFMLQIINPSFELGFNQASFILGIAYTGLFSFIIARKAKIAKDISPNNDQKHSDKEFMSLNSYAYENLNLDQNSKTKFWFFMLISKKVLVSVMIVALY